MSTLIPLDYQDPKFYYNQVVDLIVDDLVSRIDCYHKNKDDHKCDFTIFWPYVVDELAIFNYWPYYPPFLDVHFEIVRIKFPNDHAGWNVIGLATWGDDTSAIKITLQLRKGFEIGDSLLKVLEQEITNVVAHEIHHLTQYNSPLQAPNCKKIKNCFKKPQSHYEYFLDPREVPAFVMGFRAESVRVNKEIEFLVESYLENYTNVGLITSEQSRIISKAWLDFSDWSKS